MEVAEKLTAEFDDREYNDFNQFRWMVDDALKAFGIRLGVSEKKAVLNAVSWKDESAQPVIKKRERDGTVHYEPDPDLRDTENVPLTQEIDDYFQAEVLPYVPDAWIDEEKLLKVMRFPLPNTSSDINRCQVLKGLLLTFLPLHRKPRAFYRISSNRRSNFEIRRLFVEM